jgi:hypothetical protein
LERLTISGAFEYRRRQDPDKRGDRALFLWFAVCSIHNTKSSISEETSFGIVALVAGAPEFVAGMMDRSLDDINEDDGNDDVDNCGIL